MARRRREIETAGLSFLDCICCGFGAVILLLVITKIQQPVAIQQINAELARRLAELELDFELVQNETAETSDTLEQAQSRAEQDERLLAELRARLASLENALSASRQDAAVAQKIAAQLSAARQELTEEMRRLQLRPSPSLVGGIPVDSEYVIFIIDTSGSMKGYSWKRVLEKVRETLQVYPKVKGIQVMNDMGIYMFPGYKGRWIPDTPALRRRVLGQLRNWNAFSNSSPVEGITEAIRTFYARDKKVSLYVFGDEFAGGSVQAVIDEVERINQRDASGRRRVRIHSVGFPIPARQNQQTSRRFSMLMRELCHRNGGAFVALAR